MHVPYVAEPTEESSTFWPQVAQDVELVQVAQLDSQAAHVTTKSIRPLSPVFGQSISGNSTRAIAKDKYRSVICS